jgi:hypothetical protein
MLRYWSVAVMTSLAVGLLPAGAALASAAPAAGPALPNPCATFSRAAADTLFGVRPGTRVREKLSGRAGANPSRTCTAARGRKRLTVVIYRHPVSLPAGLKCVKDAKLGTHGLICVSATKTKHITVAAFRNRGHGYVRDTFNVTLPHRGSALAAFARAQRQRLDH